MYRTFVKSGLRTVGGSSGRNEKLFPLIRPLIRKHSCLKGISFWKKNGSGRQPQHAADP